MNLLPRLWFKWWTLPRFQRRFLNHYSNITIADVDLYHDKLVARNVKRIEWKKP